MADEFSSGGEVKGQGIDEYQVRLPLDPTFDLRSLGDNVPRGKSVGLKGTGQSFGQEVAAGDDEDPGRDAR
jgi:hypothetical protein